MPIATEEGDTRGDRHSQRTEGGAGSPAVFEVEDGSAPLSRQQKRTLAARWHQSGSALSHQARQAEQNHMTNS